MKKTYYEDNRLMSTTDYSGMFVYKDGHIDFAQTSEGRMKRATNGIYNAEYFIKDHLGNVRFVYSTISGPSQATDYYPFGLEIPVLASSDNKIKYNSKELQTEAKLDWYDYGARFYDPVIGRWHAVDEMAEIAADWSPYSYAFNSPIRFIDPNGMKVENCNYGISMTIINKDGFIIDHKDDPNNKNIYQVNEDGTTTIVGEEDPNEDYSIGRCIWWPSVDAFGNYSWMSNKTHSYPQPSGGAIEEDLTFESFFIGGAVLSPLKYLQIGKYIFKLVPTKSVALSETAVSILTPGGKVIGTQLAKNSAIRTISQTEAQNIVNKLITSGAKFSPKPEYPGVWYELPGGGGFGVRNVVSEKSIRFGSKGAIDVNIPGIPIKNIKY